MSTDAYLGLFRQCSRWLQQMLAEEPEGSPRYLAAHHLRAVLRDIDGPPRVAVFSKHASMPLTLPGARMVTASWPVLAVSVDLAILVSPTEPDTRMRARMSVGPAHFLHVTHPNLVAEAFSECPRELIDAARCRHLLGELCGLKARYPAVAPEVAELTAAFELGALEMDSSVQRAPRITVISPKAELRSRVEDDLLKNRPTWELVSRQSSGIDCVIAIAGPSGWGEEDLAILKDAQQKIGRLIVTAPLPLGSQVEATLASTASPVELCVAVENVMKQPIPQSLPPVQSHSWKAAAALLDAKRRASWLSAAERSPVRACRELGLVPPALTTRAVVEALAYSSLSGIALANTIGWEVGAVALVIVGALRLGAAVVRERKAWAQGEIRRLQLASTSGHSGIASGPGKWVRRKLANTDAKIN